MNDFVYCSNCSHLQVVERYTDTCPVCEEEGTLAWAVDVVDPQILRVIESLHELKRKSLTGQEVSVSQQDLAKIQTNRNQHGEITDTDVVVFRPINKIHLNIRSCHE